MTRITEYIAEGINDPNLGTKDIANTFDMNPAYLARVFKEQTGFSFGEYINRRRIEPCIRRARSEAPAVGGSLRIEYLPVVGLGAREDDGINA